MQLNIDYIINSWIKSLKKSINKIITRSKNDSENDRHPFQQSQLLLHLHPGIFLAGAAVADQLHFGARRRRQILCSHHFTVCSQSKESSQGIKRSSFSAAHVVDMPGITEARCKKGWALKSGATIRQTYGAGLWTPMKCLSEPQYAYSFSRGRACAISVTFAAMFRRATRKRGGFNLGIIFVVRDASGLWCRWTEPQNHSTLHWCRLQQKVDRGLFYLYY